MGGEVLLHATAIAVGGRAALLTGVSGSGKSSLALETLALGATLVADDRVILRRDADKLRAFAPAAIRGLIEARGVGLLRADTVDGVPVAVVVDLDRHESVRLPEVRHVSLLSCAVPLLHKSVETHFAAALVQYLRKGRRE